MPLNSSFILRWGLGFKVGRGQHACCEPSKSDLLSQATGVVLACKHWFFKQGMDADACLRAAQRGSPMCTLHARRMPGHCY